jgi:hypothetical protein
VSDTIMTERTTDDERVVALKTTGLGRLKLAVFQLITETSDTVPTRDQVADFHLREHQLNSETARLYVSILSARNSIAVAYDELAEPTDLPQLLAELEEDYRPAPWHLEITDCPPSIGNSLGVLIVCSRLRDGGLVYELTLFLEGMLGRIVRAEVRANRLSPEPVISLWGAEGWEYYTLDDVSRDPMLHLVMKILLNYDTAARSVKFVDPRSLSPMEGLRPPHDVILMEHLDAVNNGSERCTVGTTDLSLIRPFDIPTTTLAIDTLPFI